MASSKNLLRLPEPKVYSDLGGPDIDAQNDLVLTADTTLLNRAYIRSVQDKYKKLCCASCRDGR